MPKKPKAIEEKPRAELGAPAALRAIEEHEAKCRDEKEISRSLWKEAQARVCEGEEISEKAERRTHREYLDALEIWDDATKKLLAFDKQVLPAKREGEKIAVDEAKEIFHQIRLSLHLGLEAFLVRIADGEESYVKIADNMRDCFANAIQSARDQQRLPPWIEWQ